MRFDYRISSETIKNLRVTFTSKISGKNKEDRYKVAGKCFSPKDVNDNEYIRRQDKNRSGRKT